MNYTLFTDGGSRGNPGQAAIGGVIYGDTAVIAEYSEAIGIATNNQAEYRSLIAGLTLASYHHVRRLSCYLDSELVVKQLNGAYKIKDADIRARHDEIQRLIVQFDALSFTHIPREKNVRADELVNAALDKSV